MTEKDARRLTLQFLAASAFFLAAAAAAVICADPFFHYHKPWFGLAAVQDQKEYQIPGVLAHLDYDSVLCGSSVVISMDTDVLEERFGGTVVKAVADAAPAPVLTEYLRRAFESRPVRRVFYGLDVFSFYSDPDMDVFSEDVAYLANRNPFDDVRYLWNGEILVNEVPAFFENPAAEEYSWGKAYSFNDAMPAGPDQVLAGYYPTGSDKVEQQAWEEESAAVERNLNRLETIVEEHPETEFIFFLPPYPIVWWDRAYNQGMLESYEETLALCMERLLAYENVSMYTTRFNEERLITDMYQYVDVVHGSAAVTDQLAWDIGDPTMEITAENCEAQLERLWEILWRFKGRVDEEGVGFLYEVKMG